MALTQSLRREAKTNGEGLENGTFGLVAGREKGGEERLKGILYAGGWPNVTIELVSLRSNIV